MQLLVSQLESWATILTLIGFAVFWLSGKNRWGWLIGVGWEVLWVIYGIITIQYAFAFSGMVNGVICARNYIVWPKKRHSDE